jgi:hypothetical protein
MAAEEKQKGEMVSVRMPASLVAELRLVASENDRTLSDMARLALKEWLAQRQAA